MNGIERIAAERQRQIDAEGWDAEHDDEHDEAQLTGAAVCYAVHAIEIIQPLDAEQTAATIQMHWPWDVEWWKPSPDPIRNLEKAGALIAAEIDRLQRKEQP